MKYKIFLLLTMLFCGSVHAVNGTEKEESFDDFLKRMTEALIPQPKASHAAEARAEEPEDGGETVQEDEEQGQVPEQQMDLKKQRRREKDCQNSRDCRARKKAYISDLERRSEQGHADVMRLEQQLAEAKRELEELTQRLKVLGHL